MTSAAKGALIAAGAIAFALAATANAGGYRYGASDQAFYIPAIRDAMDPALFPRDGWLLAAQGRVILWDGLVAGVTELSGLPLSWIFFLFYLIGVLGLYAGVLLVARVARIPSWGTVALLALLTLRHRIAKTGVNTLEGYLHPRMIAFALGMLALASFLRRRPGWACAALVAACAVHPTTGVWFGMLLGVAAFAAWPRWRKPLAALAVVAAAATIWAIAAGPLASRAVVMDDVWLAAVATKDYLFPHEWPLYAWVFNFAPVAIVGFALWKLNNAGAEMRGLMVGALALAAFFIVTLPFVTMRYALAVQMQIPRVFWQVELVAFLAIVRFVPFARPLAIGLIALSLVRGGVVLFGEKDGRLVSIDLPADDWTDAMGWLRHQPVDVHVLADPGQAFRYGSSVRVGAERDVFHEDVKDAALAMYDRAIAVRVVERRALTHDFGSKPLAELLSLARSFDLDYLVTEERLDLPVAYQNDTFRIYVLAERRGPRTLLR
ncbi:MAG: hypothetical protein WD690_17400 [Vicinamibacterales bacterium]